MNPRRELCRTEELRALPLFEHLDDHQLATLCTQGSIATVPPGILVLEGQPATYFYALIDGEAVISRRSGGADIEMARTSQPGVHFGAWLACAREGESRWDSTVQIARPSRLFVMDALAFVGFMRSEFPMVVELFRQQLADSGRQSRLLGRRDRLLSLGNLTAGLSNQLTARAATTERSATGLRQSLGGRRRALGEFVEDGLTAHTLRMLVIVEDAVTEHVAKTFSAARQIAGQTYTPPRSQSQSADHRGRISGWLDERHLTGNPARASTFAAGGLDVDWLERISIVAADAELTRLHAVFDWLEHIVDFELRLHQISEACEHISALLVGAKQYSQMDRGAYQSVHIHEMLRSTMVMFGDQIAMAGKGRPVTLIKDLDPTLPQLLCYPGDLNQVWTHMVNNALEAMDGSGTLTLRTRRENASTIRVELSDDGPGIPAHLIDRVFTPFFTTKAPGHGAGLGLDLVRHIVVDQHGGSVDVESQPGRTTFIVRLPLRSPVRVSGQEPPAPTRPVRTPGRSAECHSARACSRNPGVP